MEILRAEVADAEEILRLQKTVYVTEAKLHDDYDIPPLTQSLSDIKREFNTHTFLKVVENGTIIAAVKACEGNGTCYIGRLIVAQEHQRKGIGTMLMANVEEQFNHQKRYVIFTGEKSHDNIRFYGKFGYKIFRTQNLNARTKLVYMEKKR